MAFSAERKRLGIFHTLQSVEILEIAGSRSGWDYTASVLIGLRFGEGRQRPSDGVRMLDGCASAKVVEFDKAARDEFGKMAGECRGGYLDGCLNVLVSFLTALQAAINANARRVGKGRGKFDDMRGRKRFAAQFDFKRGNQISQRLSFDSGSYAVFHAAADAFDLEQAARFQRPQRLAGNRQGERSTGGEFRNALRLFADELGEDAKPGGVGEHPAGSPQRGLKWFNMHLPHFAKCGILCPASKNFSAGGRGEVKFCRPLACEIFSLRQTFWHHRLMAFRIHDSVVRGEIDNRVKGIVRGKIWVEGRAEPVLLELKGNAHPDLAGCLLTFINPQKPLPLPHAEDLQSVQRGAIGDLTASRKVRVPAVPMEEFLNWPKGKGHPPSRWANCLYLEWFSEANGRVVIESADYELTISTPEWRLTAEEEAQRAKQAAAGMDDFMQKLTEAIEQQQRGQKDPEAEWDEHDYEKLMKESDARTDKYLELLDKYGDSDEAEEKIAKEMGWLTEQTEAEAEAERKRIEEMNRACEEALNAPPPEPDPHREGIDWIRTQDGELRHPLQHRCFESAMKFWKQADKFGLEKLDDKDLDQFVFEFQTTGAKLAGALNGIAEDRGSADPAFIVACLKRALGHLHRSQAGLEAVASKKLLPAKMVAEARKELFEIREGILNLMDEFRGRK